DDVVDVYLGRSLRAAQELDVVAGVGIDEPPRFHRALVPAAHVEVREPDLQHLIARIARVRLQRLPCGAEEVTVVVIQRQRRHDAQLCRGLAGVCDEVAGDGDGRYLHDVHPPPAAEQAGDERRADHDGDPWPREYLLFHPTSVRHTGRPGAWGE